MTILLLVANIAHAAPFCVKVQGITPDCNYVDAQQCRARAVQLKGICTINNTEITLTEGNQRYCVVTSERVALCHFSNRAICETDAVRRKAVCIEKPVSDITGDPYRDDPNRNY